MKKDKKNFGNRKKSREFALQVLYQLDITKQEVNKALAQCKKHFSPKGEKNGFTEQIVKGVMEHAHEIDDLIERYSENWRIGRMDIIDRNILRMAIYELLYCEEVPPKVTMNEAINLGKRYGNQDSGSFINGILDRIQNKAVHKPLQPKFLQK